MNIQLLRHATLFLEIDGRKILVDPMLSPAGAMEAAANTADHRRNPLVELPSGIPEFRQIEAVIVTHTHRDHFDQAAAGQLPKDIPLFCQPEDEATLQNFGFTQVQPVIDRFEWKGMRLTRTRGMHGRGEIGRRMGPVSGFILQTAAEPSLYIVGDSVWCEQVEKALDQYKPDVTIVFAGAAEFLQGGPITMTAEDIGQVCGRLPETKVIAAHMEAWNHCLLSRRELRSYVNEHGFEKQVVVPEDGERMKFETH